MPILTTPRCTFGLATLAVMLAFDPPWVQAQQRAGAVAGTLTTGTNRGPVPVVGAILVIQVAGLRAISDSAGTYRFSDVAPGEVRVLMRALGFQPMEALVTIRADTTSLLNFVLQRVADLPVVDVVAEGVRRGNERMLGFHMRKSTGFGRFITREQIEAKRNVSDARELLRGTPGVRLLGKGVQMASSGSSRCVVQYFVDAVHVTGPAADFLSTFRPADIEGIEVYRGPAETPPEFSRGGAGCGVIVLWTRAPGGHR